VAHYCQVCAEAQRVEPYGDGFACPVCGTAVAIARRPLFVVLGTCGAGKSTIFTALATRLRGECAVFDGDGLIDPLGPQIDTSGWFVLFDAWLHVASGVAQSGVPTMVLGQLLTQNIEDLPGRALVSDVHHLALDAPDDEIRRRLAARPAWRTLDVDGQVGYAQWLRENIPTVVSTHDRSIDDVADDVVAWFRRSTPG
jgi:hypothetical protein